MTAPNSRPSERELLRHEIARLRASIMAATFGLAGGTGLSIATLWLVVRGGDRVGSHLTLLNNYFPGYSVSWPGALLGFAYGALVGGLVGWSMAWLYNSIASYRARAGQRESSASGECDSARSPIVNADR